MSQRNSLELNDIIFRTARQSVTDIEPLLKYLGFEPKTDDLRSRAAADEIAHNLRRMGSNDLATLFRGGEGVPYSEVVFDVAEKLKATGASKEAPVEQNEAKVLEKLFADSLEQMTMDERRALFQSMNLDVKNYAIGGGAAILVQQLIREFGGFATYRFSVVIANMIARALLGSGLSFAANAAITRVVGTMLGPIGWIATGAWLAYDLAGPAFRKTVPAVVYVAMLRQMLINRVNVGVVGAGSAGKDSLLSRVFRIPAEIDPIAGSTQSAVGFQLGDTGTAEVINYPGFQDYRPSVNSRTDEMLRHTDLFIAVFDITSGISGVEIAMLDKVRKEDRPVLICLNKCDLVRTKKDEDRLYAAAVERFGTDVTIIRTIFDPDPRLGLAAAGRDEVLNWVFTQLEHAGKADVVDALRANLR
jgi:small GTP-binding protein